MGMEKSAKVTHNTVPVPKYYTTPDIKRFVGRSLP